MNILITTQKIDKNDDDLSFFLDWLVEFAKVYQKVTVICLQKGEYNLPKNVEVLSLGKERNPSLGVGHPVAKRSGAGVPDTQRMISKLKYIFNFFRYIWQERNNYDKVFVHMNPEYVVLGGLFWRLTNKKVALWYLHKSVDLKLKIAEKLTNIVFSASQESFQLPSKKLKIVGHGVDTQKYYCENSQNKKDIDILYVGRLTGIKNQKLLIEAVDIVVNSFNLKNLKVALVGWFTSDKDKRYYDELKDLIEEKKLTQNIFFKGGKPSRETVDYFCRSKITVNLCPTGGMDKVVLESMSCKVPAIAYNKTFEKLLGEEKLILQEEDPKELAEKIIYLLGESQEFRNQLGEKLRKKIVQNYSLENLIKTIKNNL